MAFIPILQMRKIESQLGEVTCLRSKWQGDLVQPGRSERNPLRAHMEVCQEFLLGQEPFPESQSLPGRHTEDGNIKSPSPVAAHGSHVTSTRAPHLGCRALEAPRAGIFLLASSRCPLRQMERGCVRGRESKTVVRSPHTLARCFQWLRATGYFLICRVLD